MPIDETRQAFHLRRRRNRKIWNNIDRLWNIARQAQGRQDILDSLHPWQDYPRLKFDNGLPLFLFCCAVLTIIMGYMLSAMLPFGLFVVMAAICALLGWSVYERSKPIQDVIDYLEQRIIETHYQLHFHRQPRHVAIPLQPVHMLAHLKNSFPLFNEGKIANDITQYASTEWLNSEQHKHSVMLFQYHYVDEIKVRNSEGQETRVKEIHKDLWGVFVFNVPALGIAINSLHRNYPHPYTEKWQPSDIAMNQQLEIYGTDQFMLAKTFTPTFTLELDAFFQQQSGQLIYHAEQNILCYLGPDDLFQVSGNNEKIQDISSLRGHLRTFKLANYEKLQQAMLKLLH